MRVIASPLIEALESLAGNKLRSALTILGIVIGVAAVIAMLAIGAGAENSVTGSIQGIGSNLLFVFSGGEEGVRVVKPLTLGDAEAIADPFVVPSVVAVAPLLQGSGEVTYSGESALTTISGVTPAYGPVRNYNVTEGEFINESHMLGRAAVVLIGPEVADKLFDRRSGLVGETVRIEGQPFRVLGVLEEKGGGFGGSDDNQVIIPLSTAQARLLRRSTQDRIDMIMVQAASAESVPQATEEISQVLRARHRTAVAEDDFTVLSQNDFLDAVSSILGVFTIFLGGIAAISLLVGGIGIMNIMLVSVIERTREIGLRKALGARKRDILIQFLAESMMLSLIGGIIGILLGWGISVAVQVIAAASDADIIPVIGIDAVLLATIFSTVVGLFFGLYPANRAASLEPVEALRYE
ncbi:MAG: ABC transporter permease [Chloroflexi bacterium]|nr:MAG: ABC transporter permease [Chloroflexota bacterium]MBL1196755.1 FtsX-like permease family protein [Chloroflexota bacterium]NOH14049.1 FtsX-like permease family protein [Chloroflexota bacterium]